MRVHDFQESLELSASYAEAPWWEDVYRQAFSDFGSMQYVREDGWSQRGGIDRAVILKSGKVFWIDEKVRTEDWPDFLLERYSDQQRKTDGWAKKDLACDYIAYAFIPSSTCYLLPFQQVRLAVATYGQQWLRAAEEKRPGYRIIEAQNNGYITESIAVPREVLLDALVDVMTIHWLRSAA
jgi:hypothetical protein